jgi:N-glycosylase/DNA lyase
VAEAFVSKYGKYAGWAQTLLFIAELPSQKALLPSHFWSIKEKKSAKSKNGKMCSGN